ncbi:unnamed protein product [Rotaria socialis]|uniref:RanBD1 domain-containing protein n=1 Tax=Rotaria socialis TaxID=392032 RepID=A0A818JK21_9BILA|nr:unnamed protein product [Rotaria socialis]
MSAPPSKPSQPTATTFNERLNEQLINCLNVQTNVIQNLSQYSQHISLQLFEIKNIVEILSNRVLALQQQQQQPYFAPSPYAASYYPNYMPQQPMPVSHPPASTHPHPAPPVPFSVQPPPPQQQPVPIRQPAMTTAATSSNFPFFPTAPANPPTSLPSSTPSFQFSTPAVVSSSQTINTNSLPALATTTSPSKSFFSNLPKFSMTDTTTKPPSLLSTIVPTTTATTNNTNEKSSNSSPFMFGTNNMTSTFGTAVLSTGSSNTSIVKPETNVDDEGDGGGEDESYEPNVSFKPIIQLSAVEVKTGEEDENVLFCERGKLYRFDSGTNQMKERGTGEMKILQHKATHVCRVLMRREQVLKICANHQITSQMDLKVHQGSANAFIWSAMDFADGEAKHETLCIRFKTDEQAKNFQKVFNEAKEINTKKTGDVPSVGKISLNDETKSKPSTNDDDIVSLGEVKPSAEQIDRAKKLQLPSTFFLYENKEPCKGCPGCEQDTPSIVPDENKTAIKNQTDAVKNDVKVTTPQSQSTTSAPKTPLSSSENIKFSFTNSDKTQSQLQKQSSTTKEEKSSVESSSPAPNATSPYDSKPSIFGNFNGNSNTSIFGASTPTNNTSSSIFGASATFKPNTNNIGFSFPGFGNAPATSAAAPPTNGFQFSSPSTPSSSTNAVAPFSFGAALASASTNKPVFGNSPKFSFSDVAKQSPTLNDKTSSSGADQRVFAGQGSLIFGTNVANTSIKATNNNDDDEGDGGGEDESYEPNVSFKPIVQLSAVEVKTGEEDENVLFCERGKLYRFDSEANQMKERGIGEMKILQHKTTNLFRILMRREQVLKLCANHQITSQMDLKPHQGSENAYVWSAMDFAEGEAKHETLCVKFKSSEVAKRFVQQFNEAKQANANHPPKAAFHHLRYYRRIEERRIGARPTQIFPPAQYFAVHF